MTDPKLENVCPTCGAQPGNRCVKLSASAKSWVVDSHGAMGGQWRKNPHPERGGTKA